MELVFACSETKLLYDVGKSVRFQAGAKVALRKLDMMAAAMSLEDLKVPPGNRLEALKGKRRGQYSIRINGQWRICFKLDSSASKIFDVEIVDYH